MAIETVELVKLRSTFYRDRYHKLIILIFLSSIMIVVLAVAIFIQSLNKAQPSYFATTQTGRVIELAPMNQPNLSSRALLKWATNAVLDVYTYNFNNFRQVFNGARKYFTDDGWKEFIAALSSSQTLQSVAQKKLVLSAVVSKPPIVNREPIGNGPQTWELQVPIMVTYQSLSEEFHENLIIVLTVQRISTLESVDGLGIVSFVARSA